MDQSCRVNENWVDLLDGGYHFKNREGTHALDWETDGCQVELATQDLLAHALEDLLACGSQSGGQLRVLQVKATVVACVCGLVVFALVLTEALESLG